MKNRILSKIVQLKIIKDTKGSPAIEEVALIAFIGLVVITKSSGVSTVIGSAFDKVITGITTGLNLT